MNILVTGGAGFIGSHTCIELIKEGFNIIVADNLCNSSRESLNRVEYISKSSVEFFEIDIRNKEGLSKIFDSCNISGVIHFAGLKSVNESLLYPEKYHSYNVLGSKNLLEVMSAYKCKNIIFSSSASVYGDPKYVPIDEKSSLNPTNPYGKTKLTIENILSDKHKSDRSWKIVALRYFNPVGAHVSGLIGEDPNGVPDNLMPLILRVASNQSQSLEIFGGDYNTKDGTGIRDYIHVVDLAKAHVSALRKILNSGSSCLTINLGTGYGVSVLDLIKTFESVTGKKVPYKIASRRDGDTEISYADPSLAYELFNWKAAKNLEEMCEDAWRWHCKNPNGYEET